MNSFDASIVQILLYILSGILAAVAIFGKKDEEKFRSKVFYVIGIIITLGLSILLEIIKANKEELSSSRREKDHRQYIDSLRKVLVKSDSLLISMDSSLKSQNKIQKLTNDLLSKTNQNLDETHKVLDQTSVLTTKQEKQIENYEKDKNPLFPFTTSLTIKISFNSRKITRELINSFMNAKSEFEKGIPYDSSVVFTMWNNKKKEIGTLHFKDINYFLKFFEKEPGIQNFKNNYYMIGVRKKLIKSNVSYENDSILFSGKISLGEHTKGEKSTVSINFLNRSIFITYVFDVFNLTYPEKNIPIGFLDIIGNYLTIGSSLFCDNELFTLKISGKNSTYSLDVKFSENDLLFTNTTCKYYYHKISPSEVCPEMFRSIRQ